MRPLMLIDVPLEETALAKLRESGEFEIDCLIPHAEAPHAVEPARLRDVEICFCSYLPTNSSDMSRLRWVQLASTGYSQLFGHDLPARQIRATNARGCFDVPIAEWVAAMMVNLVRDLRQLIRNQEKALWDRSAIFQRELRGMTVGLWGYGGIGRETARLAKQMGLRVHVLTRSGNVGPRENIYHVSGTGDPKGELPDRVFSAGKKEAFLATLDFLVVALPLTKSTEGLIGEPRAWRFAAHGLPPQPRPRPDHSGGRTDPLAARRMDCRRGIGHALSIPTAVSTRALEHAQRHPHTTHRRLITQPTVQTSPLGNLHAQRPPLCARRTFAQRTHARRDHGALMSITLCLVPFPV